MSVAFPLRPATPGACLTCLRGAVIAERAMKLWRRCLTIVPVLAGLASAMLLSCGGGSSSGTTALGIPTTLFAVFVCQGAPPTATQTPTPTKGTTKTPTPTPTPQCSPMATSTAICVPNSGSGFCQNVPTSLQFNAQGGFTTRNPKEPHAYRDITSSASTAWNPFSSNANFPGQLQYVGNGVLVAFQPGCTCFNVSDAGITSQTILIGVNQDPATCTIACPQVPTPTPPPATRATPNGVQADHGADATP